MRLNARVWTLLLLLTIGLAGCRPDPNVQFIQGDWYFNDPHLSSVAGESSLETVWTFDRGTYSMYACCFARAQETGWYEVLESEGDTLVIELSNRNGVPNSERFSVGIEIDRTAGTIEIQGSGPFERVNP